VQTNEFIPYYSAVQDFDKKPTWSIYPNPSTGRISITGTNEPFTCVSLSGKPIHIKKLSDDLYEIQTTVPGVYFIKSGNGSVQKLILQ
jgi:hypothetical protein